MPLHATDNEKKLKVITVMSLLCLLTKRQQFSEAKITYPAAAFGIFFSIPHHGLIKPTLPHLSLSIMCTP